MLGKYTMSPAEQKRREAELRRKAATTAYLAKQEENRK